MLTQNAVGSQIGSFPEHGEPVAQPCQSAVDHHDFDSCDIRPCVRPGCSCRSHRGTSPSRRWRACNSTVILWAASASDPLQLAQTQTDDDPELYINDAVFCHPLGHVCGEPLHWRR
jgi:hypothetical protein